MTASLLLAYDFNKADFDSFRNILPGVNWNVELSFVFTVKDC